MQSYPSRKPFGRKLAGVVFAPVRWVVEKCLVLYYVGTDPRTSRWAKRALVGAVLYVISPLGLVLDFLPPIGEVDDLLAFVIAVAAVAFSIKPTHVLQARQTARRWFGDTTVPPPRPQSRPPPPSLPSSPPPLPPPPIAQPPISPQPLTQPPFLPKS